MKHILLTTDFSPCAAAAYKTAAEFQKMFACRLTILSVVDPASQASSQGAMSGHTDASAEIENTRQMFFSSLPCETALIEKRSNISRDIAQYAESNSVDLIVLASHGRTGFVRARLGSITEELIRQAKCPVFVIPENERDHIPEHQGVHIVVATDLSSASLSTLPIAREIFTAYGSQRARLTLLHVAENPLDATFGFTLGGDRAAIREDAENEARERLDELLGSQLAGTLAMSSIVRATSDVPAEIIAFADNHDSDLLVLAKQGHSAIESILLGSITEAVLRNARKKILVVP